MLLYCSLLPDHVYIRKRPDSPTILQYTGSERITSPSDQRWSSSLSFNNQQKLMREMVGKLSKRSGLVADQLTSWPADQHSPICSALHFSRQALAGAVCSRNTTLTHSCGRTSAPPVALQLGTRTLVSSSKQYLLSLGLFSISWTRLEFRISLSDFVTMGFVCYVFLCQMQMVDC